MCGERKCEGDNAGECLKIRVLTVVCGGEKRSILYADAGCMTCFHTRRSSDMMRIESEVRGDTVGGGRVCLQ